MDSSCTDFQAILWATGRHLQFCGCWILPNSSLNSALFCLHSLRASAFLSLSVEFGFGIKAALQPEHTAPRPPVGCLHHSSTSPEKILGGGAGLASSGKTEQKPPHTGGDSLVSLPQYLPIFIIFYTVIYINIYIYIIIYTAAPKELGPELRSFLTAPPPCIFPNGIITVS